MRDRFKQLWVIDFEFTAPEGQRVDPVCLSALELNSGRHIELWRDELRLLKAAPFDVGHGSLVVGYNLAAEMSCFQQLGWPMPFHMVDLFVEFRNQVNGLGAPCGDGLVGACAAYGLDCMDAAGKTAMRDLIIRGGPWTPDERSAIQMYCRSDVDTTARLLHAMESCLTPYALIRARFMQAVALMEWNGVPIDTPLLGDITRAWPHIEADLVTAIDHKYKVFDGTVFKLGRFAEYLQRRNIPWPLLESGRPATDQDTFRDMAKAYPELNDLKELKSTLSSTRKFELSIGDDSRNRTYLNPFGSKTGRNQPSNAKFIFGPATWTRGLIKPSEGFATAYIDYAQEEFGIAAALSGDTQMQAAYLSGDPYLGFGKLSGVIPQDATKQSHGEMRNVLKTVVLGVQYSMGAETLAQRLCCSRTEAGRLLELHRKTFPMFWDWSDAVANYAFLRNRLYTVYDWQLHVTGTTKPNSVRNFPMQANGAEILRLACCAAIANGIKVCAPIHDALLIEASACDIRAAVETTQRCMREASAQVLSGFPLGSDYKVVMYPDRYMDPRGERMWNTVMGLLARRKEIELERRVA